MTRLPNINREANASARSALRQLAQLQKAMRSAEDGIAGLSRAIKAPVPKGGSRTIKGSRNGPNSLERAALSSFGRLLGGGLASGGDFNFDSFYQSQSQIGGKYLAMSLLGQRIR